MPSINPINYVDACAAKNAPTGEALEKAGKAIKEKATKISEEIKNAYNTAHGPVNVAENTSTETYQKALESLKAAYGI